MALLPFSPMGGSISAGSVLPEGYEYKKDEATGALQLWKDGVQIAAQDETGSWFKTAVSTGVGSLHLGGNTSGGVAHSISSSGQNVGFKNEFSKSNENEKLFFYPAWQGVSCDGSTRLPASMRSYGPLAPANEVNGAPHPSNTVLYNFTLSSSADFEVYAVSVILGEAYSGKIQNVILSNVTGAEIYNTETAISGSIGATVSISYKYPFTAKYGDNLQLQLIKDNGEYLLVRAGTTVTTQPYRALRMAVFTDKSLAAGSGYLPDRLIVTNSSGEITTSGLVNNRALVSSSVGIPATSVTTSTEIAALSGAVTIDTSSTLVDGDGVVTNDGGVIKQVSFGRVWAYISSKITGAISTFTTSNATASRVIVSDASGKLTASAVTSTELNVIDGDTARNNTINVADADGFVFNSAGSMVQLSASRVWLYISSKITGAISGFITTNASASRVIVSDGAGKLTSSPVTVDELNVIDGNTGDSDTTPTDTTRLVINNAGTMQQTNFAKLWAYISSKLPATPDILIYRNAVTSNNNTYAVAENVKGGFSVYFIISSSTVKIRVQHSTPTSARWQATVVSGTNSPATYATSSGTAYPWDAPAISTNGSSQNGQGMFTDGNQQMTTIVVNWHIISNGMGTSMLYAMIS